MIARDPSDGTSNWVGPWVFDTAHRAWYSNERYPVAMHGPPAVVVGRCMTKSLVETVQILQAYQSELQRRGVAHVAVFGSVAREEAGEDSDIDILVELDPSRPMGLFAYGNLTRYINTLLGGRADVVNRKTLKPFLRETITRDAVDAF